MKTLITLLLVLFYFCGLSQHSNHHVLYSEDADVKIQAIGYIGGEDISYSTDSWDNVSTRTPFNNSRAQTSMGVRGDVGFCVHSDGTSRDGSYTDDFWATTAGSFGGYNQSLCTGGYISADGTTTVMASGAGTLTLTLNTGSTWAQITDATIGCEFTYGPSCSGTGDTIIVGNHTSSTYLYYSHDSGVNWDSTDVSNNVYASCMSKNGNYIYLGSSGSTVNELTYSINGGSSWTSKSIVTGSDITRVACSEDGKYVLVFASSDKSIWGSSDYGNTFNQRLPTKTSPFIGWSMAISESGKHWVVGEATDANIFYYSSDYGNTWSELSISGNVDDIRACSVSEN